MRAGPVHNRKAIRSNATHKSIYNFDTIFPEPVKRSFICDLTAFRSWLIHCPAGPEQAITGQNQKK